jgi:general nucleoside transport system permease protein
MDFGFLLIVSTPLILAALGEVIGQRSGVLNIGVEGLMLFGAFFGFLVAGRTGSLPLAFGFAMALGMVLALVSGYFTVKLGADQVVVGTAVNFLALGVTGLGFRRVYAQSAQITTPPALPHFWGIDPVCVLALLLIPLIWFLLMKTHWGLALRACGEYPKSVEAAGFSVSKVRLSALVFGGALAGLAGAHLSLGVAGSFAEGMTAGRGFLAIALVTFGRWRPIWVALAALLLGYTQSLQYSLQGRPVFGVQIPSQLWLALPYVIALLVLVFVGSGTVTPKALGRPYEKEA